MPYAFLPSDASLAEAVRRVAREEAEGALAAVARAQGGEALGPRVHEMRKAVKKLRGLLRLVRPVLPEAGAENAVLRDAGRGLSALRDAAVQRATVEWLSAGMEDGRRAALMAPFRATEEAQDARAGEAALPPFADAMASLRDRSEGWRLRRDGWDGIEPGLRATWAGARAAMRVARAHPSPEALHEWRKRVKDHWYQARLLEPIWPTMMGAHVQAADDLGEALGQVNDLAVLDERLDAAELSPDLRDEARALAHARRAELLEGALPLGRRLLAGKPGATAVRWRAWWRLRDAQAAGAGAAIVPVASSMSATVSSTP